MTLSAQAVLCPNCKGVLEQPPNKKERCPLCGDLVFVKTLPGSNARVLMTAEEARRTDVEWRLIEEEQALVVFAKQLGISREVIEERKKELSEALRKPVVTRGALGSLLTAKIVELLKKEDWHTLSQFYFAQSIFLRKGSGEFFPALQRSRNCNLKEYRARGVTKIEILGHPESSCGVCRALKGKVFNIEEATERALLPIGECENAGGYCRCVYSPVVE
jgi:hypothetical protein